MYHSLSAAFAWDLAVALWLRPRVGQLVGVYRASHKPMAAAVSLNSCALMRPVSFLSSAWPNPYSSITLITRRKITRLQWHKWMNCVIIEYFW